MSRNNFIEACKETKAYTDMWCRKEVNLFCEIMGYPKSAVNHFIADDPHGVVDIMEGYRFFKMTDIRVVISKYELWMEIYKTNEELRKAVDAWYYYCQDWYEKHSQEAERGKGCPNLRSWLAGCPVEGLRKPSVRWIDENLKAREQAKLRVEECKQALYQAMEEEVKLNKF